MTLKYKNCVIFVRDIHRSKQFYTEILEQKVIHDYGRYVGFECGFGIWETAYAMSVIYPDQNKTPSADHPQTELYFESDRLDETLQALKANRVSFIHELYEHDWGQRGIRVCDPDGTIIEISEPMSAVIRRYHEQGFSPGAIAKRTGISLSEIEHYC
ncbi:VOC family protein [bacterium]|nr:VOC family protein [bacterium]